MRAGIVAIFFFAGVLALGHYVAAPFFCRGEIAIPALDPRALCGADLHLSRSGSVLLYFGSIGIAFFFGLIGAVLPGRKSAPKETPEAKPAETFEQIVAAEEKKAEDQKAEEKKQASLAPAAHPSATPAAIEAAATPVAIVPAAPAAAVKSEATPAPAAEPDNKPEVIATAPIKTEDLLMAAVGDAITVGLAAKKTGSGKTFDGTNEELLERFRELKKQEGVNSIAQAQRLLDESTLSALARGTDPKQHLSQVAHLVLAEDPDLKSGVVRGVVVHVAARLKELGVAKQNLPGAA